VAAEVVVVRVIKVPVATVLGHTVKLPADSTAKQEHLTQLMAAAEVVAEVDSMAALVVEVMAVHMVAGPVPVTPVAKQEILEQVGVIVIQMVSPLTAGIPEDNLAFLFHPD
jgi:hypothetical protein